MEAIDEWEGSGGVRELSDWLMMRKETWGDDTSRSEDCIADANANNNNTNWKQAEYRKANDIQRRIRHELINSNNDQQRLIQKLGDYNAKQFINSGIAGIPPQQTHDVKCIHAHVADHLCRISNTTEPNDDQSVLDHLLYGNDGNVIGQKALQILHDKGVNVLGNDICWQQCSGVKGWKYVAKKNRRRLKSTRLRRKELREDGEKDI